MVRVDVWLWLVGRSDARGGGGGGGGGGNGGGGGGGGCRDGGKYYSCSAK